MADWSCLWFEARNIPTLASDQHDKIVFLFLLIAQVRHKFFWKISYAAIYVHSFRVRIIDINLNIVTNQLPHPTSEHILLVVGPCRVGEE